MSIVLIEKAHKTKAEALKTSALCKGVLIFWLGFFAFKVFYIAFKCFEADNI